MTNFDVTATPSSQFQDFLGGIRTLTDGKDAVATANQWVTGPAVVPRPPVAQRLASRNGRMTPRLQMNPSQPTLPKRKMGKDPSIAHHEPIDSLPSWNLNSNMNIDPNRKKMCLVCLLMPSFFCRGGVCEWHIAHTATLKTGSWQSKRFLGTRSRLTET